MRNALSDPEKLAIVSLYELLESSNIPILASVDKIQVIGCHCPHFDLCHVCRHNRLSRLVENHFVKTIDAAWKWKAVSAAMPSTSPGLLSGICPPWCVTL
jgi:hypothetical protein